MIKSIVGIAFATVLVGSVALGQTSSSSTTVTSGRNGVTETTTTTTESNGVVTEYTPGQALVLKTEAEQPIHYKFGKKVVYVTEDGRTIESSAIKRDSKVHVHYVKDGDDMVVDRIVVRGDRD